MVWIGLASLGAIAILWEDLRWRMVHLYWYALLFAGLLGLALAVRPAAQVGIDALGNLLFSLLLLLALTAYFSIKERRWVYLFDSLLGWGDVLFFISIVAYFSLWQYIVFTVISLLFALAATPLVFYLQGKQRHIPLAGLQACCLLLLLWLAYLSCYELPRLPIVQ